jgi:hypothetical protein
MGNREALKEVTVDDLRNMMPKPLCFDVDAMGILAHGSSFACREKEAPEGKTH